ncbi:MAG: exosortase/archaeosortase family protein [Nibricoccus sp.]
MTPLSPSPIALDLRAALRRFYIAALGATLLYSLPLLSLLQFSLQSRLYSHILLIPLISFYFFRQQQPNLPAVAHPDRSLAILFAALGLITLGAYGCLKFSDVSLAVADGLAMTTASWLLIELAICSWLLGRPRTRALAFPLAMLVFMVPLPTFAEQGTETILQHGSAFVARGLFSLAGTTVFADGLVFQLPGITIQIAPECSGIHSSLVLFIISVVSGQLILRSNLRRIVLAVAVIPLALLRNGFRVFVIGELCVRKGPHMIDSYIHHHGGPIFFSLSLIPFFALLTWLIRSERNALRAKHPTST